MKSVLRESQLRTLTREQFREGCLQRDGGRCASCGRQDRPLDVHHILERRLFRAGGYFLDNGVTLCDDRQDGCHVRAERTLLSPEALRELAGIARPVLPDDLDSQGSYTKWGDRVLPGGRRSPGPLFEETPAQLMLAEGGVLELYDEARSTPLAWQLTLEGALPSGQQLLGPQLPGPGELVGRELAVSCLEGGEEISVYPGLIHGRWPEERGGPWQSDPGLAALQGQLDPGLRACGRWWPGRFVVHSFWRAQRCLSWEEGHTYAQVLGLEHQQLLWQGQAGSAEELLKVLGPLLQLSPGGLELRTPGEFEMKDWRATWAQVPGQI